MTKLGGKTGGNAVILMKMKNGVFFGRTGRKTWAAAPDTAVLSFYTGSPPGKNKKIREILRRVLTFTPGEMVKFLRKEMILCV